MNIRSLLEGKIESYLSEKIQDEISLYKLKNTIRETFNMDRLAGYVEQQDNNTYVIDFIKLLNRDLFDEIIDMLTEVDEKKAKQREEELYQKVYSITDGSDAQIQNINRLMGQVIFSIEYCWKNSLGRDEKFLLGRMNNIAKKNDKTVVNAVQDNNKIWKQVRSRTQDYIDKWNDNMFLNNFEEWDEKAGINIRLREVYIDDHLPHFFWGDNKSISDNLKALLSKYIINSNQNKMLLILGQPGIGKSTLITWITANFTNKIKDILVYQFASDLKNVDWRKPNISREILNALSLSYDNLNGKTLILDGFDEVSVGDDSRKDILNNLYNELIYKKKHPKFFFNNHM